MHSRTRAYYIALHNLFHKPQNSAGVTLKHCSQSCYGPGGAYSDISLRGADGLYPDASLGVLNAFAPRAPIKPTVTMASYVPFGTVVRIGALHRPGAPARALRICAALGLRAPPTNRWSCSSVLK